MKYFFRPASDQKQSKPGRYEEIFGSPSVIRNREKFSDRTVLTGAAGDYAEPVRFH
jgi:hypothetical protein